MPAHVPRRIFAKPFIVTVAAAAAATAACEPKPVYDNPPHNPPAQDTAAPSATTAPSATPSATTTTTAATAATTGDRSWKLERGANSTCTAQLEATCAPDQPCAEQKPAPYACPAGVTRYPATIVSLKDATECTVRVYPDMGSCPPRAHCNPPPPHDVVVPCPK